jgi:outer membrane immunogenic protein
MKKLLLVSVAWAALFAGPALAADLAPVPVVLEPVFTWTGFYAGLSAGGRWSNVTWETLAVGLAPGLSPDPTTTPVSFKNSTARLGGYLGYDWQFAPQWLFGLEADFAWGNTSRLNGGVPGTFGTTFQYAPPSAASVDSSWVKQRWDATVRARAGFLVTPAWLVYAAAGIAMESVEVGASCSGNGPSWCMDGIPRYEPVTYVRTGWTIGGGTEAALWRNWFVRIEYRYTDYGAIDYTFFTFPQTVDDVRTSVRLHTQTVIGGIAFKFN